MNEWCPLAIWLRGPAGKTGYEGVPSYLPKRGEVKHSMAGNFSSAMQILNSDTPVSWHFSIVKNDGTIYQHYELSANCWHAGDSDIDGGIRANIDLVGVEHEGGGPGNESEALTDAQIEATVALTRWMMDQYGLRDAVRYPAQSEGNYWRLAEHNEVSNNPTACPSGRIPWAEIQRLLAPVEPTPAPGLPQDVLEELADHRAKDLLLRELGAGGRYRIVSVHDDGAELTLELRNPDRTPLASPIYIPVRK